MFQNAFILAPSLRPGQAAPDFCRPDAQGTLRRLADYRGRWLILFFYPADFTSGCTLESCAFRDHYREFQGLGAEVLGISGDGVGRHQAFQDEYQLPYPLLSDGDARMRRDYGVPHFLGRLSGRCSFAIDPEGMLRHVFSSRGRYLDHVSLSLEFLRHAR